MTEKSDKKALPNIVFSAVFVILLILVAYCINQNNINIQNLELIEFFLISLAIFRTIRLIVYDKVMAWLRDLFDNSNNDFIVTIHGLLNCPWCFGVWATLLIIAIYFLVPFGDFIILILALAAVASIFQLLANLIGWNAEYKKVQTNNLEKKK